MDIVLKLHQIFGERILTLVIVLGIIYLAATWKADNERPVIGRILAVLVDLQVALGLIVYGLSFSLPRVSPGMILVHAAMGVLAAGVAHMAAKNPPFLAKMGRFSPVAGFGLALILILAAVLLGRGL